MSRPATRAGPFDDFDQAVSRHRADSDVIEGETAHGRMLLQLAEEIRAQCADYQQWTVVAVDRGSKQLQQSVAAVRRHSAEQLFDLIER